MKIIFAQGNFEPKFDKTRHNVGFALIDRFTDASWAEKPKFHAFIAEQTIDGKKVLFVKPTTYYNDTGLAARALIDFYKIDPATDLIVLHDDLALPFGTVRVRSKGSDAGNNGVKSLNNHIGEDYRRIRIGIWNAQRDVMDDVNFVLGKFTGEEKAKLDEIAAATNSLIESFIKGDLEDHSFSLPEAAS